MKNILAIFILTLAAVNFAFAQCSDADKKALEAFDKTWGDSAERGDRAALQAIYADDYMEVFPGGQTGKAQTIDDLIKQYEADKANPQAAAKIVRDDYNIACTPMTAVITHRSIVTERAGAKEQTFYARRVHILEKRGGRWQVVSDTSHPLDDAGVLLYMEMDVRDGIFKGDAAWFEKNLADEFVFIDERGKTWTKAEWLANLKSGKEKIELLELSEMRVASITGDTAIVTGVWHAKTRDEKNQSSDARFRFIDTLVKRGGSWQYLAEQLAQTP